MRCEHYWHLGIELVERGDPDPHRETCTDCTRAHRARDAIFQALPLVGRGAGDPAWRARVWQTIAQREAARARRPYRAACLIAAAAAVLVCVVHRRADEEVASRVEVISRVAMRSTSPNVGDLIRVTTPPSSEVRVYRAAVLLHRCIAASPSRACTIDATQLIADAPIAAPGTYQVIIITPATSPPLRSLEEDLQAVVARGGEYHITDLVVR